MSSKNRLGSDPLGFIKDTRDEDADKTAVEVDDVEITAEDNPEAESEKAASEKKQPEKKSKKKKKAKDNVEKTLSNATVNIQNGEKTVIEYTGDFSIYSVEEASEVFLEQLEDECTIEFDLSKVSRFDTAGFQLLLYMRFEAERYNGSIDVIHASEKVNAICSLYREFC